MLILKQNVVLNFKDLIQLYANHILKGHQHVIIMLSIGHKKIIKNVTNLPLVLGIPQLAGLWEK